MRATRRKPSGLTNESSGGSEVKFSQIVQEILDTHQERGALRTKASYLSVAKHLNKTFGQLPVSKITSADFWKMHVSRIRSEKPNLNLNNHRKLFKQAMKIAYVRGLNPIPPDGIPVPSIAKDVGRELSDDEIKRLICVCHNEELRFQIRIAIKTGMRLREMLRLRWSYISAERCSIRLPPDITKTRRGREFPIAFDLLNEFMKRKNGSEYVFPSKCGTKPRFDNKRAWKSLLKRAWIKCRWHDLRHTAATKKIRAGIPMAIVSRELGMSEAVLKRVYLHLNLEDMRASANAIKIDF